MIGALANLQRLDVSYYTLQKQAYDKLESSDWLLTEQMCCAFSSMSWSSD